MSNKVGDIGTPFFSPEEMTEEIPAPTGSDLDPITKSVTTFKLGQDEFFCTQWKPGREVPRAALFLSHGFAEYISGAYEEFARYMASRGFYVFGHDHLGHGRTTGERVQAGDVDDYVQPIIAHVEERKKLYSNLPFLLVGHSLGGMISILTILKEPKLFDFCLLMGPCVALNPDMASPLKIFFGKMARYVMPSLQLPGISLEEVTRDAEWVKRLEEDRMHWHGGFKVKQGMVTLAALKHIEENRQDFEIPVFIQHGEKDSICLASDSQIFFDKIKSQDKEIKIYPGCYHHLYIEKEEDQQKVLKDSLNWIEKKIEK